MARPGFTIHPKFRRLMATLGVPKPHVLGYIELLWAVAYENGNDRIGDELDVELACEWPGERGVLCKALEGVRLIDRRDGILHVHDLYDHAPTYVMDRLRCETERAKDKRCDQCGRAFRSP